MADPLLSSLCTICRINIPKYTCPKCSVQTCSLPCSRRHKLWSECSGIRDPTVFKSRSELCTPSGIDHDYNFLHSIETRIERSEKEIVEERRLIKKSELKGQPKEQSHHNRKRKRGPEPDRHKGLTPSEVHIDKCLRLMGIRVERAPQGMKRRTENTTNYSKPQKSINWQVEWFRDGGERLLTKAMGNKPIGLTWKDILEEDRRNRMTREEKAAVKKAVSKERESAAKRLKRDRFEVLKHPIVATSSLQNSRTTTWDITSFSTSDKKELAKLPEPDDTKFFLIRPFTPASMPKILVPLDALRSLDDQLRKRAVLEYPTIYVFENTTTIPKEFMLEKVFMIKTGEKTPDTDNDSSSSSEDNSDTSSSGSDESTEDGEISE